MIQDKKDKHYIDHGHIWYTIEKRTRKGLLNNINGHSINPKAAIKTLRAP